MNQKKELIKNTMIITIGKFSTQAISFLLLPFYTALLSTSEYGKSDFLTTLALFITPFVTLLMEESMFRFLIDADTESEKKRVINQAVIYILVSSVVLELIIYFVFNALAYKYTIYLVFYILASICIALVQSLARGLGDIKTFTISSFFSSLIMILLNVLFIGVFKLGVAGLFLAYIISNLIIAFLTAIKLRLPSYISLKNYDKKLMKEMVKYSFPLVPNSISWVIINLSDRLVVTWVMGTSANGIYSIANKFPNIINTFYGFFYTAWKESASKVIKDDNSDIYYNEIYLALKRFLMGISILLMGFMPFVFPILINKSFSEAYKYIPMLIIAMFFSNISGYYGGIFSAYKDTKIMGVTTVLAAIINLAVDIICIWKIGIWAAVISTFMADAVSCIHRRIKIKKIIDFQHDYSFIIISCITVALVGFTYFVNMLLIHIIGLLLSLIYGYIFNRIMIKNLILQFRKH